MRSVLGTIFALSLLMPPAMAGSPDPAATVRAFYTWDIAHSHAKSDRSGIKQFITAELACLEALHIDYLRAFGEVLPEDKPALAEFDLYSGFVRKPSRFTVETSTVRDTTATVQVRLFLEDDDGHGGMLDTVHLRLFKADWFIADVSYPYKMNFFKEARMRAILYEDMARVFPKMNWRLRRVNACRKKDGPA